MGEADRAAGVVEGAAPPPASSYRADTVQPLLELAGPGGRAVVVSNALDLIPDADRRDAGLVAEPLDLRDYFGKPADGGAAGGVAEVAG